MLARPYGQLGARVQVELCEDVADVGIGRARGDHQLFGNLAVGAAARQQADHLELAWAQLVGRTLWYLWSLPRVVSTLLRTRQCYSLLEGHGPTFGPGCCIHILAEVSGGGGNPAVESLALPWVGPGSGRLSKASRGCH